MALASAPRARKLQRALPCIAVLVAFAALSSYVEAFANIQVAARSPLTRRNAYVAGSSPLMVAAFEGKADQVKALVDSGAAINDQDEFGWTAIRYAVRKNHPAAARMLVDLGANVDIPSESGRTPLMSAAGNDLTDMVKELLKAGADQTLKDANGMTASDHARFGPPELKEMFSLEAKA
mmetsp:Transcript_1738/g.3852  ORF Transcript_1738/g.3852 Transcript_1738/m.3852 type:complete len:179 (-) Transcript_1738:171-707(-)|eukprot:CAMPEP_0180603242 /NCGR_PEP_ID=MMETSP1037_2-20121125/25404_1 /TAXON_ID=632150 /ORGANISM="Azadinium spinosum, Strain 3D9" /LENGTH=178 /DNA_ID=CAMNT_0022622125 /DNA_START=62 /DNA_END=598 /DNA_ORIENTATION=-